MNLIKKLFICSVTVITVVGILSSFFVLYPRRYNDNLQIQNISGDASALNDVKISGVLSDGIQKTDFFYQNKSFDREYGVVKDNSIRDYFYIKQYRPQLPNIVVRKTFIISKDSETRISSWTNLDGKEVTQTATNKANMVIDICNGLGVSVTTDVIVRSDDFRIYQYGDRFEDKFDIGIDNGVIGEYSDFMPVEIVDDKMYLYTTTGADCAGFGGVYEIKTVGKQWTVSQENLAPLDLKDGNVQIVGMKASKNWFVFITVENNQVIIKPFNRSSNTVENDIIAGPLPKSAITEWADFRHNVIMDVFYNVAIQDDEFFNIEIIEKHSEYSDEYPQSVIFCTTSLTQNEIVISYRETKSFYLFNEDRRGDFINSSETIMKYKNNKLYILRSYFQMPYVTDKALNIVQISVYENNRDVYQGEIISAAEEDYRYQGPEMYKGYGTTYMRGYYYLGID